MEQPTTIFLGEHCSKFLIDEVNSGRFSSTSEVVQAALLLFEQIETNKEALVNELIEGENSGFVPEFDRLQFLENLHKQYPSSAV